MPRSTSRGKTRSPHLTAAKPGLMTERPRRAVLVLGMHRSGTSALTRLIGYLGAAMPADAIEPHAVNAHGFWESAGIVRADDALLRAARSSWFDPRPLDLSRMGRAVTQSCRDRLWKAIKAAFNDAPLIAIKDPRQCRFVPLVVDTLAEHGVDARAALVFRPPQAAARSLERRDGTTPAFAQLLWLRHMIDAERATRALPRTVVDYEDMLQDWRRTATRLLPLAGQDALPEAEVADAITAFINPKLRHHRGDGDQTTSEPVLAGLVADVADALRALMVRDDATARQAFDGAHARLEAARWLTDDIIHDELRHRRVQAASHPHTAETMGQRSPPPPPPPPPETPEPTPEPAPASVSASDLAEAVATIRSSGLFDEAWYAATYPDIQASGLDPIEHYVMIGAVQGLNPHPLFDTVFYARQMARRIAAQGET